MRLHGQTTHASKPKPPPIDGILVVDKPREKLRTTWSNPCAGWSVSGRSGISARSIRWRPAFWCSRSGAPRGSRASTPDAASVTPARCASDLRPIPTMRTARHSDRMRLRRSNADELAACRAIRRKNSADAAGVFRKENSRPPGARTGAEKQAGGARAGRSGSLRIPADRRRRLRGAVRGGMRRGNLHSLARA